MTAIVRLAFRNALRNRRRTALTVATVTIGVAFTVVTLSFLSGLMDMMADAWSEAFGPIRVVTAEYAEREAMQPLHLNIAESAPLVARLAATEGVALAAPIVRTGALISLGDELGEDAALVTGASPEWYDAHLLASGDFVSGVWLDTHAEEEQVVLGGRVARDLGAKLGDDVLLMGRTQYGSMSPISADVVGIITGNSVIDSQAYVTLETARWMIDVPDGALEIFVYPASDSRSQLASLAASMQADLGSDYVVQPWTERNFWKDGLAVMDAMNVIFSAIIVFVMALAIFNTMTMSVLERTGEIGVMRAMGQSRSGAVLTFLTEALVIGLFGGMAGALLGSIPAMYLEKNGIHYGQDLVDDFGTDFALTTNMTGDLTPEILLLAVVVGVITAALGAFFPAIRAARIQPYEAMRAKR